MKLVVHAEANIEANQAANWYEDKQSSLGFAFLEKLENAFQRIMESPLTHPLLEFSETSHVEFRRCLLKRFPYLVIYTIREDEIFVVAVAHTRRKPNYWTDRIL